MKDYTLKRARKGLRVMTLSDSMNKKLMGAHQEAVRWTLQATLAHISSLTGDQVILDPDQEDVLQAHLGSDGNDFPFEVFLAWRWMIQGARYADVNGMDQFLEIADRAAKALSR